MYALNKVLMQMADKKNIIYALLSAVARAGRMKAGRSSELFQHNNAKL